MLAGLILAGGKSTRMGSDKSLLTLPNSQFTLLEHCHTKLKAICDNRVFISGPQHDEGIADVFQNCGPLSGIHGVITDIEAHHTNIKELLVLAVDMPDVSIEYLNNLLMTGRLKRSMCCFENYSLPLYIPLSANVTDYLSTVLKPQVNSLEGHPKKPQYSIKAMLKSLNGQQILASDPSQLSNINTLVQWQKRWTNQPSIKV
jgi:molybdopterin-guanine dinucleotide biosynthesis protein A